MNTMRKESTNDRLLTLEKQIKVLSVSESCDETGSPSNADDEMSDKPIADSVILVRKTAKSLEKNLYFPKGKIILKVINLDCPKTARNLFH